MKRGIATFTLDHGQCPRWLFERMVKLGQKMIEVIVTEYSPEEFIKRLADPVWFQSLGTVLAFDWNASGLTTVLTAALKGVGPKTIRALSLVAELIYGAKPSYEDPARYSFAHGGKDGTPYFPKLQELDRTIDFMKKVVTKTKLGFSEKQQTLLRLKALEN